MPRKTEVGVAPGEQLPLWPLASQPKANPADPCQMMCRVIRASLRDRETALRLGAYGHARHFVGRGDSSQHFLDAIITQESHAEANGPIADVRRTCAGLNVPANRFLHAYELAYGDSPAVTGVAAGRAACPIHRGRIGC